MRLKHLLIASMASFWIVLVSPVAWSHTVTETPVNGGSLICRVIIFPNGNVMVQWVKPDGGVLGRQGVDMPSTLNKCSTFNDVDKDQLKSVSRTLLEKLSLPNSDTDKVARLKGGLFQVNQALNGLHGEANIADIAENFKQELREDFYQTKIEARKTEIKEALANLDRLFPY
ncbi:MAG: hypothetical protein AB7H97_02615 [Pseudobdellovibrionaceae bacterium]